jgi:hypothetical protein
MKEDVDDVQDEKTRRSEQYGYGEQGVGGGCVPGF